MEEKMGQEELILVDGDDNVLGHLEKERCHDGAGTLHRAFSVFLFDGAGRLLIQKRSEHKRLWPLFWSNSCCSHPRRGESTENAAARRTREELGVAAALRFIYRFQYQAPFRDRGSENELCSVFIGSLPGNVELHADPAEVDAWRWISLENLENELANQGDEFTPWFKMEWSRIRSHHAGDIPSSKR